MQIISSAITGAAPNAAQTNVGHRILHFFIRTIQEWRVLRHLRASHREIAVGKAKELISFKDLE